MVAFCEVKSVYKLSLLSELRTNVYHFCDLCVNGLLLSCFTLQKELFKSAMELVEDSEKSDEITTPTDPNVRLILKRIMNIVKLHSFQSE